MLNNTKYKIQSDSVHGLLVGHTVSTLDLARKTAANAPRFEQLKRAERSQRRSRRYQDSGLAASGWRVTLW